MWAAAAGQVEECRKPVLPELMNEADCLILKWMATVWDPSPHPYSTSVMASLFEDGFLARTLPEAQHKKLVTYVLTGKNTVVSKN